MYKCENIKFNLHALSQDRVLINFYSKAHKLILKSNSKVKSTEHVATIIQHKYQGAQANLKVYKTFIKIKYSRIRNFLDYRVQNVPDNS